MKIKFSVLLGDEVNILNSIHHLVLSGHLYRDTFAVLEIRNKRLNFLFYICSFCTISVGHMCIRLVKMFIKSKLLIVYY